MFLSEKWVRFSGTCSARIPIRWGHLIDENTRQFMNVEHVLVGKAGPLFRNMLCAIVGLPLLVHRAGLGFGSPSRHPPRIDVVPSLVLNFGARSMLRVTEMQKLSG
jgi:hypothetical protein